MIILSIYTHFWNYFIDLEDFYKDKPYYELQFYR